MVLLLIYTPIAEQYTTLCLEGKHQKWTKRRSRTGLRLLLRCYPLCRNPSREGLTLGLTPRAIKWRGEKGLSWESQKLHRISPFPASAPPMPSSPSSQILPTLRHAASAVIWGRGDAPGQFYQARHGWRGAERTLKRSHLRAGRTGDGGAAQSTPGVGSLNY